MMSAILYLQLLVFTYKCVIFTNCLLQYRDMGGDACPEEAELPQVFTQYNHEF